MIDDSDDTAVTVHGALQAALDREAAIAERRAEMLRRQQLAREALLHAMKRVVNGIATQMQTWLLAIAPTVRAALSALADALGIDGTPRDARQRASTHAASRRARIVTRARGLRAKPHATP